MFVNTFSPRPDQSLLDVGGLPEVWTSQPVLFQRIDTLNIHPVDLDPNAFPQHNVRSLVGDGCALGFADKSYDIAFSNSVIEHVGSWERQQAFAREIRRVGKGVWVQAPARECPLEPHYMAPFVHWLPKGVQRKIIRWLTPYGWLQKPSPGEVNDLVENTRLLTKREIKILFPDCNIHVEKMLGFIPKSYIAIRK